jgi:hypothetical protein
MIKKEDFAMGYKETLWIIDSEIEVHSGVIQSTCTHPKLGKSAVIGTKGESLPSVEIDRVFYSEIEAYKKALELCEKNVSGLKEKRDAAIQAVSTGIKKLELIQEKIKEYEANS